MINCLKRNCNCLTDRLSDLIRIGEESKYNS